VADKAGDRVLRLQVRRAPLGRHGAQELAVSIAEKANAEHEVDEHHPDPPPIKLGSVARRANLDAWGAIVATSDHGGPVERLLAAHARQAKVANDQVVLAIHKHIAGLDVSVNAPGAVYGVHALDELAENGGNAGVRQGAAVLEVLILPYAPGGG